MPSTAAGPAASPWGIAAYRRMATSVPLPDTGDLREDVRELLRGADRHRSSPLGAILRELLAAAGGGGGIPGAVAGPVRRRRRRPVAVVLLRDGFVVRGVPSAPDDVLVEIVDEAYLRLVRRHGPAPGR
ncbi:TetR/AcrR family transcriptional regulator C-terminal ligand-binding domain-containing protein [Actinacidiphila glaucinigra]|uniref:TetR/AcrR family transcriptional regulator C-terminal ligand-binding domain-containing protein n=1 Tax=Actinacidiphila glaucinigra TaxID=235986 RepID=UPI002DD821F7|nr:TetR/AcrR family transcriptional regulator C-terminal ligand-binding domain-containing protein [Actinacidiphila glaucinigra]WSD58196.1 TetR/AcrR family transcriptional regulator C-terminal ligand-binding domain-containing protein [Actinacidiphila glaucinigra]